MGLTIKVPSGFDYISSANPLPVSILGGINGVPIGNTTPSTGAFTTLSATGSVSGTSLGITGTNDTYVARFASATGNRLRIAPLSEPNGVTVDVTDAGETTTARPLNINSPLNANAGLAVTGNISTTNPAGGAGPAWKLGVAATVSPTSPNRTLRVEIGGTTYYIHAKTTND